MLALASFISKHHPTLPITLISTADAASTPPSVTYRRLPDLAPPQPPIKNPVESFFETHRLHKPNLRAALVEISEKSRIAALVLDIFCNAAFHVSAALGIPTDFYVSNGSPGAAVFLNFPTMDETLDVDIGDMNDYLHFPGFPAIHSTPSKTVVFLCFGRRGLHSAEQLKETAVALERSGHRFLWSVRNPPGKGGDVPNLEEILPEGFLERTKEKGFVVRSWAPQSEVLSHEAVAGFVTHCGRSSVMEAVSSGVAMIAWPIDAKQKMNKVFLVEEMKAALPLDTGEGGLVTADELERRVRELMDATTGRAIRHRVAEMKASAAAAVGENGSSVLALHKFINDCCGRADG
ncbi:hypothetical protein SASPL_151119 [Salvia splendens]|uniref:Uncharacterized protein n=1 Tax=Salvia splendens TaxID=180675 RepID=A0A8X8W7C7_SALSN|nr:hypothetical protein SASPL_151119 [Salvia splendens]